MAVKTITITTDAYDRLASLKLPRESFSDVIKRVVTVRSPLRKLIGILSKEEAEELEKNIAELRKEWDRSHEEKMAKLFK